MGVFCPDLRTAPGPGDRSGTAPLPRPQNRGPAVGARNTVKHGAVCWEPVRTKRPLPGETPSPGAMTPLRMHRWVFACKLRRDFLPYDEPVPHASCLIPRRSSK